jgi:hypothetical protein
MALLTKSSPGKPKDLSAAPGAGVPGSGSDPVAERFQALLGVVVPTLVRHLPGAIRAILEERRKVAGGSVAGIEGDEEAVERFLPGLVEAMIPPFVTVISELVQEVHGQTAPPDPARATAEPAMEDKVVERFLPTLLAGLVPEILHAVPGVVAVFQGEQQLGGAEPKVSDPEVGQKILAPLVAGCIPASIQMLPELVRVLTGAPAPKDLAVHEEILTSKGWFQPIVFNWQQLAEGRPVRLQDGDLIEITTEDFASDRTQVTLSQAPHLDWWKGCALEDGHGHQMGFVEVEGGMKYAEMPALDSQGLTVSGRLVLWKAKLFGVHTPMYASPTTGMAASGCSSIGWRTASSGDSWRDPWRRRRRSTSRRPGHSPSERSPTSPASTLTRWPPHSVRPSIS